MSRMRTVLEGGLRLPKGGKLCSFMRPLGHRGKRGWRAPWGWGGEGREGATGLGGRRQKGWGAERGGWRAAQTAQRLF